MRYLQIHKEEYYSKIIQLIINYTDDAEFSSQFGLSVSFLCHIQSQQVSNRILRTKTPDMFSYLYDMRNRAYQASFFQIPFKNLLTHPLGPKGDVSTYQIQVLNSKNKHRFGKPISIYGKSLNCFYPITFCCSANATHAIDKQINILVYRMPFPIWVLNSKNKHIRKAHVKLC